MSELPSVRRVPGGGPFAGRCVPARALGGPRVRAGRAPRPVAPVPAP